ncbi:MAG: DUF885 domain-containing protein [Bacteroidota bacterium]
MKNISFLFLFTLIAIPIIGFSQNKKLDEIISSYQTYQRQELKDQNGRHRISIQDFEKRKNYYRDILNQLKKLPSQRFADQDLINYELFRFIIEDKIAHIENENYLVPMNAEGGFYSELPSSLDRRSFNDTTDYKNYLNDLKKLDLIFHDNMQLMTHGIQSGRTLPKILTNNCRAMVEAQLVQHIEDSPFYVPFKNMPDNFPESKKNELLKEAKIQVGQTNELYKLFLEFLDEKYIPKSNEYIGIVAQPNGRKIYEQRVRYFTTLNMTPEEVYETGKKEVARIKKEMEAIIQEVGFAGSFEEFLNFLRTDEQFYAKSPGELLKEASFIAKKIDGLLPKYFNKLPRNSYGVQPVPAAIAPTYTSGRYSPGNLHHGRAGNYWVNTTKLSSRPLYALPSLTLHEAVPGHHLQISLAQEMEGLPNFRKQTYLSAFGEGWALYTEWLGEEMGIYTTPYERFGKLTYEMWRACRLVVDPGMHVFGMSRQEAIDFMVNNTALSIHECTTEVDRYIGWPGQAVSYKIGELKIRELRKLCEEKMGDHFDIREFHDVVLSNGSVPLFVLERMVKEWIVATRNKATIKFRN